MQVQVVLTQDEYDILVAAAHSILQRTPADGYEHNIVRGAAKQIIGVLTPDEDA